MSNSLPVPAVNQSMDKPIKIIEFVITLLVFLGILVGIYANNESTNATQNERIKTLEVQYNKIDNKSDKILDKLETLTIIVTNKQDRKP